MPRALRLLALILLVIAMPRGGYAASPPFEAGIARIVVSDAAGPFHTIVWYPTAAPEVPWQAGPFTIRASLNAPIAAGPRFPLVLLSHGSGGAPLSHRELAASLARAGFVVVAPTHVGDAAGHPRAERQAQILMARPRQAVEALAAALADPRLEGHVDPARLGMIGYSAGGYTALVLAGARLSLAATVAYCSGEGRGDIGSCGPPRDDLSPAVRELDNWHPPTEPRLKALVLMDPLSLLFDPASLASIRIPVLLLRPQDDSYLSAAHNAQALARSLPDPPEEIVVPGRHFVFIDPCPEKLVAEAALVCKDAPGIDRAAIHRKIEGDIVRFLHQRL